LHNLPKSKEKVNPCPVFASQSWLLSEKRLNRVGELKAVVGEKVVLSVSLFVILQEGGQFAPRPVACSAIAKHHRTCGLVVPLEFEACAGQFCEMVFSVAGFDLNGPMGDWICADVDVPRQDSHCGLTGVFHMRTLFQKLVFYVRWMVGTQLRSSGFSEPYTLAECGEATRAADVTLQARLTRQPQLQL
jgi:hypothetical protein